MVTRNPSENQYAVAWICRHCGRHCVSTAELAKKPAQRPRPVRVNVVCAHCGQEKAAYFHEVVLEETVETRKRDPRRDPELHATLKS